MEISNELIHDIAEDLDCGMICYLHKKTREKVSVFDNEDLFSDLEIGESMGDDIDPNIKRVQNDRDFVEIEKMNSHESFRIMEAFVQSLDDEKLQMKLFQSLSGRKPFANFKMQIDNSGKYRQQWFDFKGKQMAEWVRDQVEAIDE